MAGPNRLQVLILSLTSDVSGGRGQRAGAGITITLMHQSTRISRAGTTQFNPESFRNNYDRGWGAHVRSSWDFQTLKITRWAATDNWYDPNPMIRHLQSRGSVWLLGEPGRKKGSCPLKRISRRNKTEIYAHQEHLGPYWCISFASPSYPNHWEPREFGGAREG